MLNWYIVHRLILVIHLNWDIKIWRFVYVLWRFSYLYFGSPCTSNKRTPFWVPLIWGFTVNKNNICQIFLYTVKPAFKGHTDEGTPCDQGTLSQNGVLSSPCWETCDEGTPVMWAHFLSDIKVSLQDRFYCNIISLAAEWSHLFLIAWN